MRHCYTLPSRVEAELTARNTGAPSGVVFVVLARVASVLLMALLATQPACALLASANGKHTGRTTCIDDPTFGVIDIVLGTGLGLGLVASGTAESSPGWLLVPGTLFTSGLVGTISADHCAGRHKREATPARPQFRGKPWDVPVPGLDPDAEPVRQSPR